MKLQKNEWIKNKQENGEINYFDKQNTENLIN